MNKNDKILGKHSNSNTEQSDTPTKRLKVEKVVNNTSPISKPTKKSAKTTTTSSMIIGKPTKSPNIPNSPTSSSPIPFSTPGKKTVKKEGIERKKKEQTTQEEFNCLLLSIESGYNKLESVVDSDLKKQNIGSPSPPTHSPVMSPVMSPQIINSLSSKLLPKEHHEKKPRILKSDHLPKLSKGPKVSKKIEKLQKKYIRYHLPDQSIRGDWTVRDDHNLLDQVLLGTSPEILNRDYLKYFSREYSVEEIKRRWKSLFYDSATSEEGVGLMVLNPFTPKYPSLSEVEKDALYNSQIHIEKQYFTNLLQENRPIFHSSRTSKYLYQTFKHMLLNQDITKFPQYISFLNSQQEKIKQINSQIQKLNQPNNNNSTINETPQNPSDSLVQTNTNVDPDTIVSSNLTTTTTTTETKTGTTTIGVGEQKPPIQDMKLVEDEHYNELVKFLYNNSLESINNSELLTNKTKWDPILTSSSIKASVIQNDLILNPFSGIPQYLLSAKKEKLDMKSMVKIEREYELDKDRESRSLAIIRGRNIRYLMKSKDILIGRNFSEKNIIDLDLQEEQPTNLNLISKKQLIIKLKSDVNFYIQNIGKNNVFVNGCPIPQNEKIHLQDLSLIEFADIRIVFEMNKVFLAKVKRHITVLTNSIEKAQLAASSTQTEESSTSSTITTTSLDKDGEK